MSSCCARHCTPWEGGGGGTCRFEPTCSHYGLEALHAHGWLKGSILTVKRLFRCHPFGGHGYDPVPVSEPPNMSGEKKGSFAPATKSH